MPANEIRSYLGDEIWQAYQKFCVVRNPFDRLVSWYYFCLSERKREFLKNLDFDEIRRGFQQFIKKRQLPMDRDTYVIDGAFCLDFFLRFENLLEDVDTACRKLGLTRDVGEMPRLKSEYRFSKAHFSEYYDPDTKQLVAETYALEIDQFGYRSST